MWAAFLYVTKGAEMADERNEQAEMAETEQQEPEQAETAEAGDEQSDDPAERERALEKTVQNLRKVERQNKKELEKLRADAQKREDAEKTELERAQAATDAAEKRVAEANNRAIRAEARAVAAELGIKTERIPYAVRLADLSDVDVSDDGEPDTAAIKAAVEQVTKDIPELVTGKAAKTGGTNPPQNDLDGLPKPYADMTIEEQTELFQRDPSLWQRAREAAGFGG